MKPALKHKWHVIIMILCFIYGGVSIVVFTLQASSLIQNQKIQTSIKSLPELTFNETQRHTSLSSNISRRGFFGGRRTYLFYPVMILSLLGSVISVLAGLSLMDMLKKKEQKELTKSVIDTMTTPEEKLVIKELDANNCELTQSELVKRTKLSKVKVHRIVKRLEALKVVSKYPYGITNKIKLEKKVYEE